MNWPYDLLQASSASLSPSKFYFHFSEIIRFKIIQNRDWFQFFFIFLQYWLKLPIGKIVRAFFFGCIGISKYKANNLKGFKNTCFILAKKFQTKAFEKSVLCSGLWLHCTNKRQATKVVFSTLLRAHLSLFHDFFLSLK